MNGWQRAMQLVTANWAKLRQQGLIATLIRGASAALIIQASGAGITYLTQVLLAQWMGADDYGIYDYVMTLSTVLALLAGLGLSGAVLRFAPEYRQAKLGTAARVSDWQLVANGGHWRNDCDDRHHTPILGRPNTQFAIPENPIVVGILADSFASAAETPAGNGTEHSPNFPGLCPVFHLLSAFADSGCIRLATDPGTVDE
jgi:hypothetical protein